MNSYRRRPDRVDICAGQVRLGPNSSRDSKYERSRQLCNPLDETGDTRRCRREYRAG